MTTNETNIIFSGLIGGLLDSVNSLSFEPFAYKRRFRIVVVKESSK